MALLDTFLKLMTEKRAERLVITAGRVPFLLRQGETIELAMPALPATMIHRIASEIHGAPPPETPPGQPTTGTLSTPESAGFGYLLHTHGRDWQIEIHPLDSPPPSPTTPLPTPPAAVPPSSAPPSHPTPLPTTTRPDPDLLAAIDAALLRQASDLFLSAGRPIRIRIDGKIEILEAFLPSPDQILALLPDAANREAFDTSGSADFAATWEFPAGPRRIRINVFRHLHGVAAALRPIRARPPRFADLSLPQDWLDLTSLSSGLVLVAGTSGSGKSTTLAAWVDHINHSRHSHILTIEDPVEFEHQDHHCLIHQREVGRDVPSFAAGLRAALRENPDVILLGELRDLETISAALTAAETGHLVLATLHAGSASAAVNRIVDVFPGHQQAHVRTQLSLSLRAVLAQRLLPARAGGRIPACETLRVTPAVANGIREGQDHFMRNSMLTGQEQGMTTLEQSLARLVRDRIIERETALRHCPDPQALTRMLS